jgi:plasmid stabilization system protein ParE
MKWRIEVDASAVLEAAFEWYEAARQGLGARFLDEFENGVRAIAATPHAWHPLGDGLRRFRLRRFPYGIIYLDRPEDTEEIVIIAVAHLHRRPDYWRERVGHC